MKSRFWCTQLLLFMLILLLVSPLAAQDATPEPVGLRPDAPTYALHGPYWVGTQEFVIDESGERPLPTTVWYPALNPDGSAEKSIYTIDAGIPLVVEGYAISTATPDSVHGPYPLIIQSHGLGGSRFSSVYLTEHLASYGFVVMAIDHTGNTLSDTSSSTFGQGVMTSFVDRPLDIGRAIDYAIMLAGNGQPFESLIDTEHIAVIGWSFGGYTAFAVAGARMGFVNEAVDLCHKDPTSDTGCWVADSERVLINERGTGRTPGEEWPSFGDSRVDAIAGFAPWILSVSEEGLSEVKIPTLIMFGTGDFDTPPLVNGARAYSHISSSQKLQISLDFAFHGIFGNACNTFTPNLITLAMEFYPYCSDTVWDMDRGHDLINHFTTAFLLDVLKGDTDAVAALTPDAVSFPGIGYEAEGFE